MKRLKLLAALLLYPLLTFAQFSGSGSGTENDPYLILNPVHLNQIRNYLNTEGVYFKMMANIDLTEYIEDEWPDQGWLPIGLSSHPFKGILDGNGKTIRGLRINRPTSDYVGLFAKIQQSSIKNLTIISADIQGGNFVGTLTGDGTNSTIIGCQLSGEIKGTQYVGGFVGEGSTSFSDCHSTAKVSATGESVGGLIGRGWGNSITNCSSSNTIIIGTTKVGGLLGSEYLGKISISNSFFIGEVKGSSEIGGLVGYYNGTNMYNSTYTYNSFVMGDVVASGNNVGGIIGYSSFGFLTNVYFSGSVNGKDAVGGLVGNGNNVELSASYASAMIVGEKQVGGLCGYISSATIKSCIAVNSSIHAKVSDVGSVYVGRVYGYGSAGSGTIGATGTTEENKVWNQTITMQNGIAINIIDGAQHGSGVSASTLKYKATYVAAGWTFGADGWAIQETECYPYLSWQTAPPIITSNLVANETTISGRCVDGGTVFLEIDGEKQQTISDGHNWSFTVNPLKAGHTVRIYAKAADKVQSYFTVESVSYPGSGTEEDPYRVYTADDLTGMYRKGYYKLMNDIDLSSWINLNSPTEGWVALGREGSQMTQFDGNGHQISGLWTNTTSDYVGLFSMFSNGTIKDLTVVTAPGKKVKGGNYTGVLIGRNTNGKIIDCNIVGDVEGAANVGGVVGATTNNQLTNLSFSGTITSSSATACVGGLVGTSTEDVITKCQTEATITTSGDNANVGGVAGVAKATIAQCQTTGNYNATGATSHVGGIVGTNLLDGNIVNCCSNAALQSSYSAAGIVSYNYGIVENSLASGNIFSRNYGAGIIGYNDGSAATINHCVALNNKIEIDYESEQIQQGGGYGQRIIGGIKNGAAAPEMDNYALNTMQVSVNDVTQRVYDDIMNGTAKTAEELMQQTTYTSISWDFNSIWDIREGTSIPYLLWIVNGNPVTNISIDNTLLLAVGGTATLTAIVLPLSASNKTVTWSSDNETVAKVVDGQVTAYSIGTATITVAANDGSGVTATCVVTVTANKADAIAELRSYVSEAQSLYDNSEEGTEFGQYVGGSRAQLKAAINSVNSRINDDMDDATIAECMTDIQEAISIFRSQQISAGEDTDISEYNNVIYVETVEALPGQQFELPIQLKNDVNVAGVSFTLNLPDGMTLMKDEDDEVVYSLNEGRAKSTRFSVYWAEDANGNYGFRIMPTSTVTISGTEGAVLTVTVNVADDLAEGEYKVMLKSNSLTVKDSEGQLSTQDLPNTLTTFTVVDVTPGDANGDGRVDLTDAVMIVYSSLGVPQTGFKERAADVNNDGRIDLTDAIVVVYKSLGIEPKNAPRLREVEPE